MLFSDCWHLVVKRGRGGAASASPLGPLNTSHWAPARVLNELPVRRTLRFIGVKVHLTPRRRGEVVVPLVQSNDAVVGVVVAFLGDKVKAVPVKTSGPPF